MPDVPAFDIENAPLEEFNNPDSAIASILGQMQGAADRSRPIETIQHANRPMPSNAFGTSPDELIAMLLGGAATGGGGGALDLRRFYGR